MVIWSAKASGERLGEVLDGLLVVQLVDNLALFRVRLAKCRRRLNIVRSLHACNRAGT